MCIVGPPRPIEAPHNSPNNIRTAFPKAIGKDNTIERCLWFFIFKAAMVCGIPLPCAPNK